MIKMKKTEVFKDSKGRDIIDNDGAPITYNLIRERYRANLPAIIAAKIINKPTPFVYIGLQRQVLGIGVAVLCPGGKYSYSIPPDAVFNYLNIDFED